VFYSIKNIVPRHLMQCCANIQNFELNSYFSIRFEASTIIRNYRILTITNFLL